MSNFSRSLHKFWQELKRRNVFRVVAMYAGAAFVIIELINNVVDPLRLPEWLPTIVILLLIVGFPLTAILSWIFDMTPEGVMKTEPMEGSVEEQEPSKAGRRRLRPSDIIIAVLVIAVGILVYPKIFSHDTFKDARGSDGKVSIAVMPFENLAGDTLYDIWQGGFQNLLITTLSNSEELSVRKYQAVNEVLHNKKDVNLNALSPSFINVLAEKLDAKTLILGNILKAGNKIRINAQLVDAETEEIYKAYQVDGNSENDLFALADSLSVMIKNYIEIKKISDQYNSPEITGNALTNSSEAFKHYIRGWDAFKYVELGSAIDWFTKAIEADSAFINAYVFNSYTNLMAGNDMQARHWCNIAYEKRAGLRTEEKLIVDQLNAYFNETPYEEIKYLKQLIEIDKMNPLYWHQLAFSYYKLFEYEDAVNSWEQVFRIHEKWGSDYSNPYTYFLMGDAYHKLGEHKKEKEVLALGNRVHPYAIMIQQHQAICAFTQGDTVRANKILSEYKTIRQEVIHCREALISSGIGTIYSSAKLFDEAENYYRKTIDLEPDNLYWVYEFAWFLIDNEIDVEEGLALTEKILTAYPKHWATLDAKGWGLYKLGKHEESLRLLKDAWELKPVYSHNGYLHIQEVEKALANQEIKL
jgi:TolB-like protein/Tfp pilus assembly protein PilF